MPTSVRLDETTERLLGALARRMSVSRSEVIRRAIQALSASERRARGDRPAGPYDRAADLLGCVSGGPSDLSSETGQHFKELLEAAAAAAGRPGHPSGGRDRKHSPERGR